MLQLFVFPGSPTYDLPSIDADSLVAASYLQLLRPGDWQLVYTTDAGSSPNGTLPYLKDGLESLPATAILHHLAKTAEHGNHPSRLESPQARAFHALLDTTLLPLALHSLFSLPQNWTFVRRLIASNLGYPFKLYRPEQLRTAAAFVVDSSHPDWWGMGGEAEKEEENEKQRKKLLTDQRLEAWKEKKDDERREGKERIRKTFGEGKMAAAAREIFTSLETTLAQSSTPFFFSATSPQPLDAHLSALLSLVLYLPLPQPLLADLINASFPRLWTHTALLRRTLWSDSPSPTLAPAPSFSLSTVLSDFIPPSPTSWWFGTSGGDLRPKKKSAATPSEVKKEQEFIRKRRWFWGVVVVGVVGWAVGVGALPLPGRPGIWGLREGEFEGGEEEEGGWEYVQAEE